jgi:hypothetical protein
MDKVIAGRRDKTEKVVLLFDEAQVLIKKGTDSSAALIFRTICWWLREKRWLPIVAVFAGTTAELTNIFPAEPLEAGTSRDRRRRHKNVSDENEHFNQMEMQLYKPFTANE